MFSYEDYLTDKIEQLIETKSQDEAILHKLQNTPYQPKTPALTQAQEEIEQTLQQLAKNEQQRLISFPSHNLQQLAKQKDHATQTRTEELIKKTKGYFHKNLSLQEQEELETLQKLHNFYTDTLTLLKQHPQNTPEQLKAKSLILNGYEHSFLVDSSNDKFILTTQSPTKDKIILELLQFFEQAKKELGYETKAQIFSGQWTKNQKIKDDLQKKLDFIQKEAPYATRKDREQQKQQEQDIALLEKEIHISAQAIRRLINKRKFFTSNEGNQTNYNPITTKPETLQTLYNLHYDAHKTQNQDEPLSRTTHIATDNEIRTIFLNLQQLTQQNPLIQSLYAPDTYRIIESDNFQAYVIGNTAYISRGYLTSAQHLPLINTYLIALLNIQDTPETTLPSQYQHYIITARQLAHPYDIPTLTSYRDVQVILNVDTNLMGNLREKREMTGIKTNAIGTPEDIRPQPLDILTGGGHNLSNFSYSITNFMGNQGQDTTHRRGYQALEMYLKDLPSYSTTHLYFENIKNWQAHFKQYQQQADQLTARLGQRESLIQMLSTMQAFIPAETPDRINFHYSGAERIQFLKEL